MCNCLYSVVNILMVLRLALGWLAFKAKQGTKTVFLSINMYKTDKESCLIIILTG